MYSDLCGHARGSVHVQRRAVGFAKRDECAGACMYNGEGRGVCREGWMWQRRRTRAGDVMGKSGRVQRRSGHGRDVFGEGGRGCASRRARHVKVEGGGRKVSVAVEDGRRAWRVATVEGKSGWEQVLFCTRRD